MANKVFNMAGGLHSAAAYSAFEDAMYGSSVATSSDFVATAGTGMNVSLSAGNGLISTGTGFARRIASDAVNTIAITAAASSPRIDSIVAYIDNSVTPSTEVVDNTNDILKFVAVAGTAAATPSAPSTATIQSAIGAGNPYMVLWEVTIPASATALTGATFTDKRTIASNLDAIDSLRNELSAFNLTDFTEVAGSSISVHSSITGSGTLHLAQSASGSVFKFYGTWYMTRTSTSSASVTKTDIPGYSGYYGIDSGLILNSAPTSAFQVDAAGVTLRCSTDNTSVNSAYATAFAVGTDGHIYLEPSTTQTWSLFTSAQDRRIFHPCLYFNTDFGDGREDE